jgi:hypothetical protein
MPGPTVSSPATGTVHEGDSKRIVETLRAKLTSKFAAPAAAATPQTYARPRRSKIPWETAATE